MLLVLLLLGIVAGVMTTVAGLGGGVLLLLSLSLLTDPKLALAATAPALLLGNLHRAWMYRREVDRGVAARFVVGALIGSLAGGMLLVKIPPSVVRWLVASMTLLAVLRMTRVVAFSPPRGALGPAGVLLGALTATSGGAGVLVSPVLIGAGLRGAGYVATAAAAGVALHLGRLVAYGSTGLLSSRSLAYSALLAGALVVGNAVGDRVRGHVDAVLSRRIEVGAVVVSAALALVGVT